VIRGGVRRWDARVPHPDAARVSTALPGHSLVRVVGVEGQGVDDDRALGPEGNAQGLGSAAERTGDGHRDGIAVPPRIAAVVEIADVEEGAALAAVRASLVLARSVVHGTSFR
jgi:hypothetical protein